MGGIMSTFPIAVAAYIGRETFAQVARFLMILFVLDLSGFLIAGQSFDRLGSYDPAYLVFMGLDIAAMILVLTVKPQKLAVD